MDRSKIDNWNTEKIQRETLQGYFKKIAKNISSDLATVAAIRSKREYAYENSVRWLNFEDRRDFYEPAEIDFVSRTLDEARALHYFDANTSGYEALRSSGNLDQMQGTDIETLIHDYYDTVSRIAHIEGDHNDYNRQLWLQVLAKWPENLEMWEFTTASALTTDRFQSRQATYRQVLDEINMAALLESPQSVGDLLLAYDQLDRLGRAFGQMVELGTVNFNETIISILDGIYDPASGIGYPNLVADGKPSWQSYFLAASDASDPRVSYNASDEERQSPFNFNSLRRTGDSLHIDYAGGVEWAGIWFVAGTSNANSRSPDFSTFDRLVLELKGDVGGEKIHVNLEDRDDPLDGTSTKITLQLSDQWRMYEIDLADFVTADLTILNVPLGFVFYEEPQSFSVRTAKFVKTD